MTASELSVHDIRARLHDLLPELRVRYHVSGFWLFGSRLRGDARPDSDLDVLVEFEQAPSFFDYIELEDRLSEAAGVKVDLVMKRTLKPQIGQRILKEMVPI